MREFTIFVFIFMTILSKGQIDTIYYNQLGLKAIGNYKNKKEDGKWTYWYLNTNDKQSEGKYENGIVTGIWTNWHQNGQKYSQGNYQNGAKNGVWFTWDSLGRKTAEDNFLDGQRNGSTMGWNYEKGEKTIGEMNNDKLKGLVQWRTLSDNKLILAVTYQNGMKEGNLIYYYPNGKIKSIGSFKNDKEDGEHIWYNENGTIKGKVTYRNGAILR